MTDRPSPGRAFNPTSSSSTSAFPQAMGSRSSTGCRSKARHPSSSSRPPTERTYGADAAMRVATDAVRMFGGYGYTREYPLEKLMRDAKLLQIDEGTSQIQRVVIARNLLGR
jgi:hypothetical protein